MRILMVLVWVLLGTACTSRGAANRYMDSAYESYAGGDCQSALLALSQAERMGRPGNGMQPEISLLRGNCLERQGLYVDAAQTYRFIQSRFPYSEYAWRAKARLDTLQQLGYLRMGEPAIVWPAPR